MSKYIGETEKNVSRVFDAAEKGGAVLFFDEADALFGKRTEVKDSHDRYANIQVNYLLERIEGFGSPAILSTRNRRRLDNAFLRPSAFLKYYLEGRVRRVVLPLHSYELLAFLIVLAWVTNREWLWGYVLGMALHLPLDIVFNGRLVPGGLVHFYSFAVRARAGFLAEHFADPTRLAPLADNFWVSFFKGSRLKSARASTPRRASARPRPATVRESLGS